MKKHTITEQVIPLILTVVIFAILAMLIYFEIVLLNRFSHVDIVAHIRWSDIFIGMTIYLKTSVDFAIFIGNLMASYPGWKNRISIEIGTAAGNALGTMIILAIWNFFRDIEWLLALMIFIAALVLFRLAEDGIHHAREGDRGFPKWFRLIMDRMGDGLERLNSFTNIFLKYIIPHTSMKPTGNLNFWGLFAASFSVPFILGLDDFAGYVPVFNIVNVFGFSIGVLLGHMILNIFLFIAPSKTIRIVKNPIISFIGSLAFIALALWGFWEVYRILGGHH